MNAPPGILRSTSSATLELPVIDDPVARYRAKLLREAGLQSPSGSHFERPQERPFTKGERETTTILIGGLTLKHEELMCAAMGGLGYRVDLVPVPTKADFQTGKEYGNNGQCNPTYFTVGALVTYLKRLRDEEGLATSRILNDYVFFTAGACGPCRFGMYEAEYRLALRNSGFDGFRVMLLQQSQGLSQVQSDSGLELDLKFMLSLLNAIFIGDLLNAVTNHVRPYETEPGKTDEVFARCVAICREKLRQKSYDNIASGKLHALFCKFLPLESPGDVANFVDQLRGSYYVDALAECAQIINSEIEVDYTKPRPIVKVTGEFWAQTTEGDGNYRMFSFLEREGAEVLVEPVATWIDYMLNQARNKARDRKGLSDVEVHGRKRRRASKGKSTVRHIGRMLAFRLAGKVLSREFNRLRAALGGTVHELVNQQELVRMGHPFYNSRAGGGEGHLEVAKNIYYTNKSLAHMVLSLKPFGCMPSTQSDGAQAAVVSQYPEMIYLPIETSGEGDINAYSRVQMALGEAKVKCKDEFKTAVANSGYSLEEIRKYVADHRELRRPLQRIRHVNGVIGRAASFVHHVARLMDRDRTKAVEPTPRGKPRSSNQRRSSNDFLSETAAGRAEEQPV